MERSSAEFLKKLIETPSPSGFEQPAQKLIRERLKDSVDEIRTDVHGNVIAVKNPDAPLRVMLAGHCDEIGLMITHIDDKGYLFFATIGGLDPSILIGQRVEIHSARGRLDGVIGRKAVHLMEADERGKALKIKDCWVDIGAKDRKDALKAVAIGDPITISRRFFHLRNQLISGRGFDDRVGAWTVVETMRRIRNLKLGCAVYGVSTVQEEIGLRGATTAAFGIDPHAGIAIDVGFASDHPDVDKKLVGDISLGKGPILHRGANINPVLASLMEAAAKKARIPFQMQAEPRATGTDANAIQINRAGAAAALMSVPNRYMHTPVEVCSLKDLDNGVNLLVATLRELKPNQQFIP
jgi:putative aminopeptidase FrvX